MSDLVINVRQIGNYPGLSESDGTEQLLVQRGGLGGPYNSMATATLVATALRDGSLEIGNTMPGDASAGQVFADAAVFPPDGWLGLNFYDGNNQGRYWGNGPAAQIGFTLDQPQGITIAMWPSGQSGTPVPSARQITALTLSTHGDLQLPNGTLTVSRNPGAPMEVATQSYVSATTVASFNQRRGNVQLNEHDLNTALGICAPNFIATDQSVQQRLQELLAGHPFVWSVNGRVGNIWINDQDVAHAYFAPGACPVAPTPPSNSNDYRIANTEWVNKTLYGTGTNSLWDRLLKTFAPINSPDFTGIPTAPEAPADGNDNQIATVKWVRDHQTQSVGGVASFNLRTGAVTLTQSDITNAGGITQASADGRYLQITGGTLTGSVTQSGASSVISTMGYMYAQRFVVTNNQGATQTGLWGQAGNDSSQMVVGSATGTLSNVTLAAPATSANPLIWGTQTSGANRRWRMQSTGAEQATDNGSGSSFSLAYAVGQFGSWNTVFTVTRNPTITFAVPTSVPTPTLNAHAATKQYVDQAPFLPIAGGTILGAISWAGTPTDPSQLATKQYVDSTASNLTTFLGTYNAATNTPNLVGFVPGNGQYWIVSVAGTPPAGVIGVGGVPVNAGDMLIWDEAAPGYIRVAAGGITQAQADARYLQLSGGTVINTGGSTTLSIANSTAYARLLLVTLGAPAAGQVSTLLALSNNNNQAWGMWLGDNQTTMWLGQLTLPGYTPANINVGSLGIVPGGVTFPTNSTITTGAASTINIGSTSAINFGQFSTVTLGQDPTQPLQAATKQYVDTHVPDLSVYLPLTGGTIGSNGAGSLSPTLTINAPQDAPGGYGRNLVLDSSNHYGAIFFPRGADQYFVGNYGANIRMGYFSTTGAEYAGFSFSSTGIASITGQRTGGTSGNSGAVTISTAQIASAPGTSGTITVSTGTIASTATSGASGAISLTTGNNSATGNSGSISLTTGTAATANSFVGNLILRTGNPGTGAFDGTISVQVGTLQHIAMTNPTGITLGPTGTVPIVLGRDPQALMEAATKQYVDNAIVAADQGFLRLTGGQMSGAIETIPPVNPADAVNKAYVDAELASLSLFVSIWQVAANIPPLTGQTETDGDYYIAVTATPTVPETAPIGTPGIAGQLVNNGDMVIWSAANGVYDIIRGGPLNVAEANALYVQKIGDTMQGPLVLNTTTGTLLTFQRNGTPYVTQVVSGSGIYTLTSTNTLNLIGPGNGNLQITGADTSLYAPTNGSVNLNAASSISLNASNGTITVNKDPTTALGVATKQYVDAVSVQLANYLPLTGGTLNKPSGSVLSIYSNEDGPLLAGGNNLFLDTTNHRGALYFPYAGGNYFVSQVGGALQLGHVVTPGGGNNEFYALNYSQNTGNLTLTSQRPGTNSGALSLTTSVIAGTGNGSSGAVTLASGSISGQVPAGNSGNLTIQTGSLSSTGTGNSGGITIQTGNNNRSSQFVGSIVLNTGTASGGATPGTISLRLGSANYIALSTTTGITLGSNNTMPIVLGRDPQNPTEAATKNYVDSQLGSFLPLAGGTLSGALTVGGPGQNSLTITPSTGGSPVVISSSNTQMQMTGYLSISTNYVPHFSVNSTGTGNLTVSRYSSNGTMVAEFQYQNSATEFRISTASTVSVTVARDPTLPLGIATKQYVDQHVPNLSGYLPTSGGTITGAINWTGPVTADTNLATKSYVDTAVSAASQFQGTWDVVNNVPDLTQVTPLNGQYWIASSTGTAPAGVPGIGGRTVSSGDTVIWQTSTNGFQVISAGGITQPEADARYVQLAGSTMTGPLTLAGDASQNLQPVTLQQTNAVLATKLNLSGGTLTGFLTLNADPTNPLQAATAGYVDSRVASAAFLPLSGGALSGNLTVSTTGRSAVSIVGPGNGSAVRPSLVLNPSAGGALSVGLIAANGPILQISQFNDPQGNGPSPLMTIASASSGGARLFVPLTMDSNNDLTLARDPTAALQATTKQYVDGAVGGVSAQLANYLPRSGGQMTGTIQMMPPVNTTDGATKGYVDAEIASLSVFVSTWQVAANTPPLTGVNEGDGDYYIAVTANPNVAETAPAGVPGLAGRSIDNGDMVIWSASTRTYQLIRGGPLNVAEANGLYVQRTGSTMTGPLVLSGDATNGLGATTLNQVNAGLATKLNLTGGTLSGALTLVGNAATGLQAVPLQQLNSVVAGYLALSGGSMTGALTLVANATAPLQATTLQQMQVADNAKLNLTGGTLTGALILNADPTVALGAATRQYVDSRIPSLSGYLPLTGGTISGALQIGAGNPQGFPFYVNGSALIGASVQSTNFLAVATAPSAATFAAINQASGTGAGFWYDAAGPVLQLGSTQVSGQAATAWLSAYPTYVQTAGNLGVGVTPPSTAAPPNPAYGGGWMFGWGTTVQNVAANLFWDGTNWRRLNTTPGYLIGFSASQMQFSYSPAGAANSLAAMQMLTSLTTSFFTIEPTVYVDSGRVVAHTAAQQNPAFCVYDSSQGASSAMWEGASGTLQFGDADGLGNPTAMRMQLDRASNLYIGGTLSQGSDRRLKRDVRDETRGLSTLARLRPRSFMRLESDRRELGFVAQELGGALPEAVGEVMLDGQTLMTIAPMMILTVLVNAVNELAEQIRYPRRRRRRL